MTVRPWVEIEKEEILRAIMATGSVVGAANALGKSYSTLYRRLKKYNLQVKVNQILGELRKQQSLPILSK